MTNYERGQRHRPRPLIQTLGTQQPLPSCTALLRPYGPAADDLDAVYTDIGTGRQAAWHAISSSARERRTHPQRRSSKVEDTPPSLFSKTEELALGGCARGYMD